MWNLNGLLIFAGILGALLLAVYLLLVMAWMQKWYRRATNGRPLEWLRARRGRGRGLAELAQRLGLEVDELQSLEPSYRETYIPKRRGGQRRLLVPAPELKKVQRRILHRLLGRLRAHPAATGFETGKSIVHNALPHVGQRVVIKMDIIDFFPTTSVKRLDAYFRRVGWNAEVAALLTRLCTHEGGLPQGAPTSPRLSNLVNFVLDVRLAQFVRLRKGAYTRYADDITISFPKDDPRRVRGTVQFVRRLARRLGYRVHVRGKLRVLRRHQQQRVTGLIVNEKVQLPRRTRRRLRAVQHCMRTGGKPTLSQQQLAGWHSLQQMIEEQAAAGERTL